MGRRLAWRPSVRLVIACGVLLPLVSTGGLIASSALSAWHTRQHAQVAAQDAQQLRDVAAARAEMNNLEVPLTAVSYAEQVGVSESELNALLHPSVPFGVQLSETTARIASQPAFTSTPTLRDDVRQLTSLVPQVADGTASFSTVHAFTNKMAADLDDLWYQAYDRLQNDISVWQPPGSFEVHAAALRQTYQAFLAGGHEVEGATYVLEGIGPPDAKQEVIQSAGDFQSATGQFVGHLSPKAAAAWQSIQSSPADRQFAATIQQGVDVALGNLRPPFVGNLSFAGASLAPGLHYLSDLNRLVTSASTDLHDTATAQATSATHRLIGELVFLGLLALVCLVGIVVASRAVTRPLTRLATMAHRIRSGEFHIERVPETGPAEIAATAAAFNEMALTLQGVEAKAVALATEDLSHPELLNPLPGRTGQALQASVDVLATRIREREVQRQLLHEAATHDALTGLLNRAAIFDYLTEDVSRRREAGETVAVLFVDLDGLKPLNDTYGHEVGDSAILTTATALVSATEPCDVVGRLGGDEFLVVLCHQHSCSSSEAVDRIRRSVAQRRISVDGRQLSLEASVGIALAQCDGDTDPMVLVRQADEAMYHAKKAARAARDRVRLS